MVGASSMSDELKDYWQVYIRRSRPAVDLHDDKSIRPYPGPCTLFYSARRSSNAKAVAARMPGLRLIPVPAGHMEMLQDRFVERMLAL